MEAVPCILRNGNSLPVYGLLIRQTQHEQVLQPFLSAAVNGNTKSAASRSCQGAQQKLNNGSRNATKTSKPLLTNEQLGHVVEGSGAKHLAARPCHKSYPTILPRKCATNLQVVSLSNNCSTVSPGTVNVSSVYIPAATVQQLQKQNKPLSANANTEQIISQPIAVGNCLPTCIAPQAMVVEPNSQIHCKKRLPTMDQCSQLKERSDSGDCPVATTYWYAQREQKSEHELSGPLDCYRDHQIAPPCTENGTYGSYDFGNTLCGKPVAGANKFMSDTRCSSKGSQTDEMSYSDRYLQDTDWNDLSTVAQDCTSDGISSLHLVSAFNRAYADERQDDSQHGMSTIHGSHRLPPVVVHPALNGLLEGSHSSASAADAVSALGPMDQHAPMGICNFNLPVDGTTNSRPSCRSQAMRTGIVLGEADLDLPNTELGRLDECDVSKQNKSESEQGARWSETHLARVADGQGETTNVAFSGQGASTDTDFIAYEVAATQRAGIQSSIDSEGCNGQSFPHASFPRTSFAQQVSPAVLHATPLNQKNIFGKASLDEHGRSCTYGSLISAEASSIDARSANCDTASSVALSLPSEIRSADCLLTIACQSGAMDPWSQQHSGVQSDEFGDMPLLLAEARMQQTKKSNQTKKHSSRCSRNSKWGFRLDHSKQRSVAQISKANAVGRKPAKAISAQQSPNDCKEKTKSLQQESLVEIIVSALSPENLESFSRLLEEEMKKASASAKPLALTNGKRHDGSKFNPLVDGRPRECASNGGTASPTTEMHAPSQAICLSCPASNSVQAKLRQPLSRRKQRMLHRLLDYRIKARRFLQRGGEQRIPRDQTDCDDTMDQLCCQIAQLFAPASLGSSSSSKPWLSRNRFESRKMSIVLSKSRISFQMNQSQEGADDIFAAAGFS